MTNTNLCGARALLGRGRCWSCWCIRHSEIWTCREDDIQTKNCVETRITPHKKFSRAKRNDAGRRRAVIKRTRGRHWGTPVQATQKLWMATVLLRCLCFSSLVSSWLLHPLRN